MPLYRKFRELWLPTAVPCRLSEHTHSTVPSAVQLEIKSVKDTVSFDRYVSAVRCAMLFCSVEVEECVFCLICRDLMINAVA